MKNPNPEKIRPEVHAMATRTARITLDEYNAFRGNSWELEHIIPNLDAEAFAKGVANTLNNVKHNDSNTRRPCLTYDEALAVVWMPEAMKRLDAIEKTAPYRTIADLQAKVEALDAAGGLLKLALIAAPNKFGTTNGGALIAILEFDKARAL